MKALRTILGCLAIGMLVGCQKEKPTNPTSDTGSWGAPKAGPRTNLRVFVDDGPGQPVYCILLGGNCLNDVEVVGQKAPVINFVWDEVASGDQARIKLAFSEYAEELSSFMYMEDIDGVVDGTYTVKNRKAKEGHIPERFLLVVEDGSVLSAYPLVGE